MSERTKDSYGLADDGAESLPAPRTSGSTNPLGASFPPPASPSTPPAIAISVRRAVDDDHRFIFATWLRSYFHSSWFARHIHRYLFFTFHHQIIERILDRGASVLIATPEGDPSTILGYLVYEPGVSLPTLTIGADEASHVTQQPGAVIHFVYVKDAFRRLQIATRLIAASGVDPNRCHFTHRTDREQRDRLTREIIERGNSDDLLRKWSGAIYDPYLV